MKDLTTSTGLLHHVAKIMTDLDEKKIDVQTAGAQASLIKQQNNILRYDLDVLKFNAKLKELEQSNKSLNQKQ